MLIYSVKFVTLSQSVIWQSDSTDKSAVTCFVLVFHFFRAQFGWITIPQQCCADVCSLQDYVELFCKLPTISEILLYTQCS